MFICKSCETRYNKWSGKCESCGEWSSLEPFAGAAKDRSPSIPVQTLEEIREPRNRLMPTGFHAFDQLFSGGLPRGALILLGGEPGVGKSTFAMQIAGKLKASEKEPVLYVSGEESPYQIKKRASRLDLEENHFLIYADPVVENILNQCAERKPLFTIIDSIQTIHSRDIPSETGSPNQIKAAAHKILEEQKRLNLTTLIIGQITKDGQIAGPKMLEHLVDTVFYLESHKEQNIRLLRLRKNRFGPAQELCLFKMRDSGLFPIDNINQELLGRAEKNKSVQGSAFTAIHDASQIFLTEVQALVTKTLFGYPQRKCFGLNSNRLQILSAVISKFTDTALQSADIHLSVAGGEQTKDPVSDLAVTTAILSSARNLSIPQNWIFLGEVGLGGEIKPVKNLSSKIKEAQKMGFEKAFVPDQSGIQIDFPIRKIKSIGELEIFLKKIP